MGKIVVEEKKLIFERKDERIVIEPYGANCLRCRTTRNNTILDEDWTLQKPVTRDSCVTSGDEEFATIINGKIKATLRAGNFWDGGVVTYYKGDKQILHTKFEGDYVNKHTHVEGEHYHIKVIFDANKGEHFYGLGQEQEDVLDRKGSTCELVHYNTKSVIPVLYSSLGYGFFWNNPAIGHCETTNNHTMWEVYSAYQADYLVYAEDTPAKTLQLYCDLTGYAPKFPSWAAGYWQCKMRYESQEDLLAAAREYKKRNIPIDVIVIDFFHWTEQGEWKFDPKYWPDPAAMCKELKELGIRPIVSIWPTINPHSENWDTMSEENMLVRTENGQYGTFEFHGQQTFIDTMNPKTAKFVWNKVKENYYNYGIKNFWLDEAEPEIHPQSFGHLKFYRGNGAQTALLYPYYYAKMFYDGLKAEGEEEPLALTRAAYAGSQKFGVVVWNGDIQSNFDALKKSVKSGLSMGMSGIPWWTTDIGGFINGDIESDYFKELIVRWFQFGVFSPIMRLHGARNRTKNQVDRHPDIIEPSGGDNEIWSFGEQNYEIIKKLIRLRDRLKEYTCHFMDIASETGAPIIRPMFFEYPDDEVCYTLEEQYMYGSDILFAPIVEQGCVEKEVYLPEGEWIRTLDGQIFDGKQTILCHAKLDEFIAFVKKGSEVIKVFED